MNRSLVSAALNGAAALRCAAAIAVALAAALVGGPAAMISPAFAEDAFGTFSIIGYDSLTREIGVAVQSRAFNVGQAVPWARAGIGAIATQAQTNLSFGPRGLAMLAEGQTASDVLLALVNSDTLSAHRQLGVMDASGGGATFTGNQCLDWAGGRAEPGEFVCQGNILAGAAVVEGMARAFRETKGELAERLLAALDSAQAAGGDKRGKQSSAILVVRPSGTHPQFEERYVNLHVEDHPDPIVELRRLFRIHQGTDLLDAHFTYLEEAKAAGMTQMAAIEQERIGAITRAALAEDRDAGTLNGLAWACATHDVLLDEAVQLARRAVALDSANVDVLDTLAEALFRNGAAKEAIAVETRAAAIDPKSDYLRKQIERFKKGR